MTQFTAKHTEENFNAPASSPVKEFGELLLKSLGVLLLLYWLSGLMVIMLAPRIPASLEIKIGKMLQGNFKGKTELTADPKAQEILNRLVQSSGSRLPQFDYQVSVIKLDAANAWALPGGSILVTTGLLKEVKSENELAMVLSHELGHYMNHDHLKGLGRGLLLTVFSAVFIGTDATTAKFLSSSLGGVEMKFSREQETSADLFALDLLDSTYQNVSGATDFFETLMNGEKLPKFVYLMASHPQPQKRFEQLQKAIAEKNYQQGEKIPWKVSDAEPEAP